MNRFSGWTAKDVERLTGKGMQVEEKPLTKTVKTKSVKNTKDYVGMISGALTMLKVDHVREYKFLHDRRFRFDIAIPGKKIAVEFEGGIFEQGRHTRGKGFANDAKKYNLATMHGWKLLRFTSDDVNEINWELRAASEIKELINKSN